MQNFQEMIIKIKEIGDRNIQLAEKKHLKFYLGQIVISPGCQQKGFNEDNGQLIDIFNRYINCDWGKLPEEDIALNEKTVSSGYGDIMGEYFIDGIKIWIQTQLDEVTITKIYLPEEW